MDGRITALRVGFLSSSHQLAGLNFSNASSGEKQPGPGLIYGCFRVVLTAVCWLVVWQVLTLEFGVSFLLQLSSES